jgi:hypothetical protein
MKCTIKGFENGFVFKTLDELFAKLREVFNVSASMSLTVQDSGTTKCLSGVWGSSPTDVFAVGYNGTILLTKLR